MTHRRGLLLTPKKKPDKHMMQKRGVIAYLMARSKQYRTYSIGNLTAWIDPPIFTEQLAVFYRWNDSEPVGYVTWALLAPDVEHRWLHDPQVLLHESEWNEGESLWIMDFLALPGYCEDIVEFIEQNMFAGYSEARSVRRNADGTVRKVSTWRRRERHSRIAGADEISTLSVE
jgi:cytolysin-activating lysine-acyltransferase